MTQLIVDDTIENADWLRHVKPPPKGRKYDPDEPRDDHGRWTTGGAGGMDAGSIPTSADFTHLSADQAKALADMYKVAAADKPAFDARVSEIAKAVEGKPVLAPLKGAARAEEKVVNDYNGDASKIGDLLRASVVAPDKATIDRTVSEIRSKFDVVSEKNRIASPGPDGYRDVMFKVRAPGGEMAEIQVHVPAMFAMKMQTEALYHQLRTIAGNGSHLSATDYGRVSALTQQMRANYDRAWAATKASHASGETSIPLRIAESNGKSRGGSVSNARQCAAPSAEGTIATGMSSTSSSREPSGSVEEVLGAMRAEYMGDEALAQGLDRLRRLFTG